MKRTIHNIRPELRLLLILLAIAWWFTPSAYSLPASHYAANSVLSEGQWATVRCSQEGMHIITDATLRNLGFSDPEKVRVYGTGGLPTPEGLSEAMADDLPIVPSVRTAKGIVFYASGNVKWNMSVNVSRVYDHEFHAYSEDILYFISDRETGKEVAETDLSPSPGGNRVNSFTQRILHEQEEEHFGESGRTYLGEDFRATRNRSFKFSMPGKCSNSVSVITNFGAKVIGGGSSITLKANGTPLRKVSGDSIRSCQTTSYGVLSLSERIVDIPEENLELNIDYSYNGVIYLARLDYIQLEYTRAMRLDKELLVTGMFQGGDVLAIDNCTADTRIWDVTNPARPATVSFTLEGSTALVANPAKEYKEFIVFNPGEITRNAQSGKKVANQDLHAMEAPDMLIISPSEYFEGARMIAELHQTDDDMSVEIIDPALIYNEFSGGKKDVSAFRKLLKMWHDRSEGKTRFCLIMGKPTFDNKMKGTIRNAGYNPVPIWQSLDGTSETSSYSNDDYIGMLDDVEPADFFMYRANINVAVGRIPVTSSDEARTIASKIVKHARNADLGAWRNKVMIIADDGDSNAHFTQAQQCYDNYRRHGNGADYLYDRLYLDSYPLETSATGHVYPQATAKMMANFNEGVALTNYIGHASSTGWGHENLFTWPQIQSMTNKNLTFIYAATCRFMPWDEAGASGGEVLMLNPEAGICGMIAASRTVYIAQNGTLNQYTCDEMFRVGEDGRSRPLGLIYVEGKNRYLNDENKLRYAFMGDPAMRLNNIRYHVQIDRIGDRDTDDGGRAPEIPGGSVLSLSGHISDNFGELSADFNGTVSIQLYDAETVIETYGNGADGISTSYNDRKNRLAIANATVKDGKWSTTFNVPMEISNNYSPALVSAYACDDSGREANGSSEYLYIYGFSTEQTDTVGPDIEYLRLNSDKFVSGGMVNPSPVVFARINDPSGVNISDAGVGHKISLRLDDLTPYDDVAQSFTIDTDGQSGSLMYALADVAPGHHTLTLEVWDNLNNSSRQTIDFNVNAAADPYIMSLSTDCNPATSGVTFRITVDQPNTPMNSELYVYDLNGRIVWESSGKENTGSGGTISTYWNLCDNSGNRVPRGIYLYKALVRTSQGQWTTQTNRLAVTAQ